MLRAAIHIALSKRLAMENLKVVDTLELSEPKTKQVFSSLKSFLSGRVNALLVPDVGNKKIFLAARNIPKVKALNVHSLNVEDILKYKNILIEQKAVAHIK